MRIPTVICLLYQLRSCVQSLTVEAAVLIFSRQLCLCGKRKRGEPQIVSLFCDTQRLVPFNHKCPPPDVKESEQEVKVI